MATAPNVKLPRNYDLETLIPTPRDVPRNIFNVPELEAALEERLTRLPQELDLESRTQIETWVRTTFRKHAIRDSDIDFFSFHTKHQPIMSALHSVLPQLMGCALADLEERYVQPWHGFTTKAQRQLIARLLPPLCAELDPVGGAILTGDAEFPDWADEDQIYGNVNTHNLLMDLDDLLDVMTSEWFKHNLTSLPKMSRPQVHASHVKWVKWLSEQAQMNEDPATLVKLFEFEGNMVLVELTTEANLKREGALCKHCLGGDGYALKIKSKKYRYFSVRRTDAETPEQTSVLTIEMATKHNLITQVRGFSNRKPTLAEMKMLRPFFDSLDAMPNGVPFDVEVKAGKAVAVVADDEDDGDDWDDAEEEDDEEEDEEDDEEEEADYEEEQPDHVQARAIGARNPRAAWPGLAP